MKGWEIEELGKVAPVMASKTVPAEDEVWLLNLDKVESNTGTVLDYLYVPVDSVGTSTCRFDTTNVLYSKLRPYLNKVVMPGRDGYATSEMLPLKPDPNRLTREYLTIFLRSPQFVEYISSKVSGAKMPRANTNALMQTRIPLPSIPEQQDVSFEILKIWDAISIKKKQLEQLDLLIKSRFIEMFGDPIENTKHWDVRPLSDCLERIRYGTSTPPQFSEQGFAFIRATNIKNGRIVENDMKHISQEAAMGLIKCQLSEGEMIIVRSGVNTGDTCVITSKYKSQYAGYDIILTLNSEINSTFLNVLLNTEYMEKVIKPLTKRAAQPHLNSEQVQGLPIIQVPIELQNQFSNFVINADKSKSRLEQVLNQLQLLYEARMEHYFSGFKS
jgi:type I restriction enzyme S subunit